MLKVVVEDEELVRKGIVLTVEVDEPLRDVPVPKLMLQPLVETPFCTASGTAPAARSASAPTARRRT